MLESVIATAGVTPTVPPLAPVSASVDAAFSVPAERVRSWPPVSVAPFARSAVVCSVTMFSATAAPTPTFFVVTASCAGSAFAVEDDFDAADSVTSPVPASTLAAPSTSARVVRLTIWIATDPATPTFPPPAPEVASVSKVSVESVPTAVMPASRVTPVAWTVAPASTTASLTTFASVTETATPMPTPELELPLEAATAEPSDLAVASAFVELLSVSAPGVATVVPPVT